MRIHSDFIDYYDYYLMDLPSHKIFNRMTNEGPDRMAQFGILEIEGIKTVPHGLVYDLLKKHNQVVAYADIKAHCGQGKALINKGSYSGFIGMFGSAYTGVPGISWRQLCIGRREFWLEYKSTESWMSNVGDGSIEVIGIGVNRTGIKQPLFAIDYVIDDDLYACDFNVAPGIKGTGVEHLISGKDAAREIWEAIQ